MSGRHGNILETVGNTPVIRINRLAPEHVNLYVKVESFNPLGSVKDRLALGIIEDAERLGKLKPGMTVVEATSGNTGIGLAMVCAAKGYPLVIVMAENFSVERRKLMRFLGAKVVLTPAAEKGIGMTRKAIELSEAHGWFLTRQFENEANPEIHSRTTAREILETFGEGELDYWVTGFGTGGTLRGVSRVLKEESPGTKVVVCEPDNSQLLGSGIEQERNTDGTPVESHPNFRPHLMQGWSPDFIPKITEDAVSAGHVDRVVPINGDDARQGSKDLAQKEGIFVGTSGGATFAGALEVARGAEEGATILCMLPDTGERYLTTPLFATVGEEMNEEEEAISKSTPGYRFDVSTPGLDVDEEDEESVEPAKAEVDEEAKEFMAEILRDKKRPVVMFALEWCEFCWSVRNFFAHYGIEYLSVDLDSVRYQEGGRGGKIRAALNAETGMETIPQVFIGGKFVGGGTELFDAHNEGRLGELFEGCGLGFEAEEGLDAYQFLPAWTRKK